LVEQAIVETKDSDRTAAGAGESDVKVGDWVQADNGAKGKVAEIRGDGSVVLLLNSVRMVLAPGVRLRPAATPRSALKDTAAVPAPPSRAASMAGADPVSQGSEVDFRGMRVDELEDALHHALDAAILQDYPYLRIIHGKGTGALRERVRDVLERDPRVRSFALAPSNQGGDGVTVVEFA
jgi:DNA mismatch repair protein MutS2